MFLPSLNADLTLDPKGRVMLPRALRSFYDLAGINKLVAFANGGPRAGLALYRLGDYEALQAQHQGADPMDPKARLFALAVASTAQQVSIDSAGRVLLPANLRALLGLERELRLFAAGSWVEIWDRSRYETQAYPQAAGIWDQLCGLESLVSPGLSAADGAEAEGA